MNHASWLKTRWGLAGTFGLGLSLLTFNVAASTARGAFTIEQESTRFQLRKIDQTLRDYQVRHGAPAPYLSEVWPDEMGDGWNRPFLYSVRDGKTLVESLGRDGVRGGIGLDADLSNLHPNPAEAQLPLSQKLTHPTGRLFGATALVCGLIAATLVFSGLGNVPVASKSWPLLGLQLFLSFAGAALMAAFGAAFIAIAHIPSGH